MKVLKPGREQKGWSKTFTCTGDGNGGGGCGAELLVEQGDLFKTFRHCRDETDVFITFQCTACEVLTDLKAKDQPPYAITSLLPTGTVAERRARARD